MPCVTCARTSVDGRWCGRQIAWRRLMVCGWQSLPPSLPLLAFWPLSSFGVKLLTLSPFGRVRIVFCHNGCSPFRALGFWCQACAVDLKVAWAAGSCTETVARAAVGCAWRSPEWHGFRDLLLVHTGVTRSERNLADCLSELIRENAFSGRFQASDDCVSRPSAKNAVTARICVLYGDFSGRSDGGFRCFGSQVGGHGYWIPLREVQGLYGAPTYGFQSDFVVTCSGGLFGLFGPLRPAKRAARLSRPWWVVLSGRWSSKRN